MEFITTTKGKPPLIFRGQGQTITWKAGINHCANNTSRSRTLRVRSRDMSGTNFGRTRARPGPAFELATPLHISVARVSRIFSGH